MAESDIKLFNEIETLKSEIGNEDFTRTVLKHDIANLKKAAEFKSKELEDSKWKVRKAEFVSYYEQTKQESFREKMEQFNVSLLQSPLSDDHETKIMGQKKEIKEELKHRNDKLLKKVEGESIKNDGIKQAIKEVKQIIAILEKRNCAIMRRYQKQRQEIEYKEQVLLAKMRTLEVNKRYSRTGKF